MSPGRTTKGVQRMKTERLWKDASSGTGDCPSLNRVIEGPAGYVIVGKPVDAETRAQVPEVGPDEVVFWVPPDVIDRIRGL
jgi:hypothetical protein